MFEPPPNRGAFLLHCNTVPMAKRTNLEAPTKRLLHQQFQGRFRTHAWKYVPTTLSSSMDISKALECHFYDTQVQDKIPAKPQHTFLVLPHIIRDDTHMASMKIVQFS